MAKTMQSGHDWYVQLRYELKIHILEPTGWSSLNEFLFVWIDRDEFMRRVNKSKLMTNPTERINDTANVYLTIPRPLFEKLATMANDIEQQDNRITAKPYFYQIMQTERISGIDEAYGEKFFWQYKQDSDHQYEPDDLPEDFNEDDYEKIYYVERQTYKNVFFTEAAAFNYLYDNKRYLKEATTFLAHADNNPQLKAIFQFLKLCLIKEYHTDKEAVESGKKILRDRGTNFNVFKRELSLLLESVTLFDEDDWVEFYNSYASHNFLHTLSIREWAEFHLGKSKLKKEQAKSDEKTTKV